LEEAENKLLPNFLLIMTGRHSLNNLRPESLLSSEPVEVASENLKDEIL